MPPIAAITTPRRFIEAKSLLPSLVARGACASEGGAGAAHAGPMPTRRSVDSGGDKRVRPLSSWNLSLFPRHISTPRLVLELPGEADYASVLDMAKEPSMFAYSPGVRMVPEEAWNLLLRHVGHWQLAGYGVFSVRERGSGRFVGLVGGSSFRRGIGRWFDDHPELTWSIIEEFRGRGYATEAAMAVLDAFDAMPSVGGTVCLIHVDNRASLRVAARLGFQLFKHHDYRGYRAGLFRRVERREVHPFP